jgi:dihydroxy-acid dehydratase
VNYSLQSRDLIADAVETAAGGHWLDGMVVVPGCDKNMPGTMIALGRLNRPGMMVYGGTIKPGKCGGGSSGRPEEQLDIVSAFQSYGRYLQEGQTEEAEKTRFETIRNACPGSGACGGVSYSHTDRADCRCTLPTPWHRPSRPWACVFLDLPRSQPSTPRSSQRPTRSELP